MILVLAVLTGCAAAAPLPPKAVQLNQDGAAALAYQRDQRVAYPSINDGAEQISAAYDVSAPPTLIVVDKHGAIASRFLGTLVGLKDELSRLQ